MKYYIIAGEASGDLHGSNLMRGIMQLEPGAEFRFWGGDRMASVAAHPPVKHYRDLAFMGFLEVVMNLKTILGNIDFCKKDIQNYRPDVLVLVDYPGFNLRIAKFAKSLGIRVVYYISPQLWAWKEGRVEIIRKYVDEMLVILPFEEEFYQKHGVRAHFVGHPLLDELQQLSPPNPAEFRKVNDLSGRPIIALLPGSRRQEVEKMLRVMLSVVPRFPEHQFVIAGAPSLPPDFYGRFAAAGVKFVQNKTYDLLQISEAALVTSGTATLETALLNVPQVVCYRGSRISYLIARQLVKNIQYISLVNLILGREAVTELIQSDLTTQNLVAELQKVLGDNRPKVLADYAELRQQLGGPGASLRAAEFIVKM